MKVCVLVSGGLDSVTALHHLAREQQVVSTLTFDYGAKHNPREIPCAAAQCAGLGLAHRVIPLAFMNETFASDLLAGGGDIPDGHYAEESMKRTVVPFRNGILLAIAAGYAESTGAEALAIAAHGGDHAIYPDCRPAFMDAMAAAIREGTYARIALLFPFLHLDKAGIVRRGAQLGVDFSLTWSCYKGRLRHCGSCGTCVERREAFSLAGIHDPTDYEQTGPLPAAPIVSPQ
ncbi:MAG: 7-cyano-7-deazaguanine synthase QueC [Verrucomicrobiales bacterium]|nr:7-cyano-7-deazaguanine synthase QueC [Verrucomicrobiales bacterium]